MQIIRLIISFCLAAFNKKENRIIVKRYQSPIFLLHRHVHPAVVPEEKNSPYLAIPEKRIVGQGKFVLHTSA